jgi:phytoene dehydrogenase-like protein
VDEKYDVVIVGAGPGGLTAGSILSRRGLRVLVLDRNEGPGGTSRSFHCGGFSFPAGPLSFGNPAHVLDKLGTPEDTLESSFKRSRFLIRAFGRDLPVAVPPSLLTEELCRLFPGEVEGIRAFMRDREEVVKALSAAPEGETPPLPQRLRVSAADYLAERIEDRSLVKMLGTIGTDEPVFGFPLLSVMWDIMSVRGTWYPVGGFDSLAAWIAAEITARGSRVSLCSEVLKIIVRNGRAGGVMLSSGDVIAAGAVISNADFKSTFLNLVDAGSQPPEWRNAVAQARETPSNLQVSLGLDASKVDLSAFSLANRIIYRREPAEYQSTELNWKDREIDPDALAGEQLELSLPGGDYPTPAPDGSAAMVIRVAADHAHFKRFRPERCKRKPEYAAYKARLARSLIREASKLLPGLEDAVVVSDVASPLTFEEYGGRYAGAVAGWSQRHQDVQDYSVRPLIHTPIEGLYMAGIQAFSWLYWGGVPSAVLSGARAAEAALGGDGPVCDIFIPRAGSDTVS